MPIPVCVNPAGMPKDDFGRPLLGDQAFGELVRQSFAQWQALPSSYVTINYLGLCAADPTSHGDGINVVGWTPLPPGNEAGYTWVQSVGDSIREADIVISNGPVLQRYASQMIFYRDVVLPTTVLHEAGHFLGLDHSSAPCALMSRDAFNTRMCQDDIDGLAALYPGPQRATNLTLTTFVCGPSGRPDVTFAWSQSPEVDGYWLDLTLDPFFASFLNVSVPRTASSFTWPALLPNLTHYWRLWNYNGYGGGHSIGGAFVSPRCYEGLPLPGEPTGLTVGASCAADGTVTVTFSWNRVAAADGYWVDLTLDPLFRGYLNAPAPGQANTSLVWQGLLANTVHYWRVWAYNIFTGIHGYGIPFLTPDC